MNGRFPFDQHNARRQQQINAANGVRAALGLSPNVLDAETYYANLQQQNHQQNHQQLQLQRALQDVRLYSDLQQQRQHQQQQQQQQEQNDYALQQLLLAEQAISMPYRQAYEQQLLRQLQRDTQQQQHQQPVMALPSNPMMSANAMGSAGLGYSALGTPLIGSPAMGASPSMGRSSIGSSPVGPSAMASPAMGSPGVGPVTAGKPSLNRKPPTESPTLPAKRKQPPSKPTSPNRPKKQNRNTGNQQKPKRTKATPTEASVPTDGSLDVLAGAAGLISQHDGIMLSMSTILKAAEEVEDTSAVAEEVATAFTKVTPGDLASEDEDDDEDLLIETPFFRSKAPEWPRTKTQYWFPTNHVNRAPVELVEDGAEKEAQDAQTNTEDSTIDSWWPSVNAIKRERRNTGINENEDDFADNANNEPYRVNEPEVRYRLGNQMEPGVLEKLPHCRIHFLTSKQRNHILNSSFSELAFCVQVTDLYPNDPLLLCSSCGTWRHAKCGGRCTPSSGAMDRDARLSTICDLCCAESPYVEESNVGLERLRRQRMEHTRRTLATSAVIRHFSNSKNAGTYKWPMGSVSAAHINGHIRSVHVRHEKAEKQWSDMTGRLARSLGFRARDRVKNRQREFERLLSALEDAEAFTDRHNMFLFLTRDTSKATPAGFEIEDRNIFDPADDEKVEEMLSSVFNGNETGASNCERQGCQKQQRFDSRFCSDACGVACLEMDLLRTLEDAGEVHPSFLRTAV